MSIRYAQHRRSYSHVSTGGDFGCARLYHYIVVVAMILDACVRSTTIEYKFVVVRADYGVRLTNLYVSALTLLL